MSQTILQKRTMKLFKLTSFIVLLFIFNCINAQNLDFDFIKNCINYSDEELIVNLNPKGFRLITKEHKNLGDKLINKSDYYSNKADKEATVEGNAETAIFFNGKRSKKTVFISFTQSQSFNNFNNLETEIKKNFKKENVFQSEKYESSILKFSNGEVLYYLFKEEDTYYIIIANSPLEDNYFKG